MTCNNLKSPLSALSARTLTVNHPCAASLLFLWQGRQWHLSAFLAFLSLGPWGTLVKTAGAWYSRTTLQTRKRAGERLWDHQVAFPHHSITERSFLVLADAKTPASIRQVFIKPISKCWLMPNSVNPNPHASKSSVAGRAWTGAGRLPFAVIAGSSIEAT